MIATNCPNCNASFQLPDEFAGEQVRCQQCERIFTVEAVKPTGAPDIKSAILVLSSAEYPSPRPAVASGAKKTAAPGKTKSGSGVLVLLLLLAGFGFSSCLCCGGVIVGGGYEFLAIRDVGHGDDPQVVAVNHPQKEPKIAPPVPIIDKDRGPDKIPDDKVKNIDDDKKDANKDKEKPADPIKPKNDVPIVKPEPKIEGISIVQRTTNEGGHVVRDLSLTATVALASAASTEPCWDAQGKYLYWLEKERLHKIHHEAKKIVATLDLKTPCNLLALSSEGLLTRTINDELLLIDPDRMTVRQPIKFSAARSLAAAPASATAVVLAAEIFLIDTQIGKTITPQFINAPGVFVGVKNIALTPDGKTLFVQAQDYSLHRFRLNGIQLIHDGARAGSGSKLTASFHISPDSKRLAIAYPGTIKAAMVDDTGIFAIHDWNNPICTLPRMRGVAFDARGGVYGCTDMGEIRYYPDPVRMGERFDAMKPPIVMRRILTPPQGHGCLLLAAVLKGQASRAIWLEMAGKN